jgi:hypothetical protein
MGWNAGASLQSLTSSKTWRKNTISESKHRTNNILSFQNKYGNFIQI